jgi:hypothetical protein
MGLAMGMATRGAKVKKLTIIRKQKGPYISHGRRRALSHRQQHYPFVLQWFNPNTYPSELYWRGFGARRSWIGGEAGACGFV